MARVTAFLREPAAQRFRRVWLGEAVSLLGDVSFEVTFAWLVLATTHSAATLAAVLAAMAIPRGALLLIGGAIADRLSARSMMLAAHIGRGVVMFALTTLAFTGNVTVGALFATAISFGVADAFFWPASRSILPTLVSPADLGIANALVLTTEQIARLTGPLLGAAMTALAGAASGLAFNTATFVIAAVTIAGAPSRSQHRTAKALAVTAVAAQIREGLRYAARNRQLRTLLALISAGALSYNGLFGVGLPALARSYGHGAFVLGVLVAAWGAGQLTGSLSATVTGLPQRWGLLIIGMAPVEAIGLVAVGLSPTPWVASAVLAILGYGVAYSNDVAIPTWIHTHADAQLLGRINSIVDLPRIALQPVSLALTGALVAITPHAAVAILAIPMLLTGAFLLTSQNAKGMLDASANA